MSATMPGTTPDQWTLVRHGRRIDLTRGEDGQWHAVLHQAPHRELVRPAHDRGVVERRLQAWTAAEFALIAPGGAQ